MLDGTLRLLCTYILTSVLAIAAVFLPLSASAESWRESGCAGVVEAELEKLDISKLGKPDGSEELNRWVGFENCKGNLIVQLSRNCHVTAIYTSGACRIPGVPHF